MIADHYSDRLRLVQYRGRGPGKGGRHSGEAVLPFKICYLNKELEEEKRIPVEYKRWGTAVIFRANGFCWPGTIC